MNNRRYRNLFSMNNVSAQILKWIMAPKQRLNSIQIKRRALKT